MMNLRIWSALTASIFACAAAWAQSAADPGYFTDKLYPVLENARCRGCHATDGVASATRLHFPDPYASPNQIRAFGLSLYVLVDRTDPTESILLNKPTNRLHHTGGERIQRDSEGEGILRGWIDYLATVSPDTIQEAMQKAASETLPAPATQFVRRLTHSQYNNTVRDLLGDYSRPADRFPAEDYVDGFKNQFRGQGMPPILVEAYGNAAERLAQNAFRAGDVNRLIPCKPLSATDEKCRNQFLRKFGERAFRRPLTDAEFNRYATLFTEQARSSGGFLEGARVVVEAMLQSPKFLFHVEGKGKDVGDRDYAVASRLSYFLWDTMPDEALLKAAAAGELRTEAGIERVARRMLDATQAHDAMNEFFAEWMRFDHVESSVKDGRRFPMYTPELATMMVEESTRLFEQMVWNDRNFMDLLTADYGFLNSELAALYGFPPPPGEFQLMRFPANSKRAGLLGQSAFLASASGPTETSPTARGVFVREQLLCQHVPSPPPGVNTNLPEPTADKPLTRRQRLQEHVSNPSCAACHRLMDPIGFGLENFDAVGRYRQEERIEISPPQGTRSSAKSVDLPLEPNGQIAGIEHSAFSGPAELGAVLAQNRTCQECVVRQVFRYAYGRLETSADEPTIARLYSAFRDSGFHVNVLIMAELRAPQFVEGLTQPDHATQARNFPTNSMVRR